MGVTKNIRHKWRRYLLPPVLLVAGCFILFFGLPSLLISEADTKQADVILHLAMDPHSDSDTYVADLYQQGYAKKIVCVSAQISWEVYPADYVRNHLILLGVPADSVLALHLVMTDCPAEAFKQIADYVKTQGWGNVLLVCTPEGSRYNRWLARRAFGGRQISSRVTYAPSEREELITKWWRTHWKVQRFGQMAMSVPLDFLYPECR